MWKITSLLKYPSVPAEYLCACQQDVTTRDCCRYGGGWVYNSAHSALPSPAKASSLQHLGTRRSWICPEKCRLGAVKHVCAADLSPSGNELHSRNRAITLTSSSEGSICSKWASYYGACLIFALGGIIVLPNQLTALGNSFS